MGYPRLGLFAPGAAIPPQSGGPLAAGASAFYLVEFSAAVLLDGSVAATGTAPDVDVYIRNTGGTVATHTSTTLPEAWTGDSLAAGTYLIEVRAYAALTTYTMTLTTRTP